MSASVAILSLMPSEPTSTPAKIRVTMSATSDWAVGFYGIVEFLRVHPVCRAFVAILGIASTVLFIAGFAGLKIPGFSVGQRIASTGFGLSSLVMSER